MLSTRNLTNYPGLVKENIELLLKVRVRLILIDKLLVSFIIKETFLCNK